MATIIQLTPEVLMSRAAEVRSIRSQHDDLINKLTSLMHNLNETWKGQAQDALIAKYEGMQSTFTNFSAMLEEYAKLMENAANRLQATEQELGQSFTP